MQGIYETNDDFDFSKLVLSKPVSIPGGNYFIRFSYLDNPLYIQPPKSTTKQGVLKTTGKRHYCDLLFSNEHDQFTRWMENLESYCQKCIFDHRIQWFDGDMELHDIENFFTPPLKSYKSGKFNLVRVQLTLTVLGKPALKVYDEQEQEIDIDSIDENTRLMTILEIQGIKCSAKSFQMEIELKQMMVLKPTILFEKCLLRNGDKSNGDKSNGEKSITMTKESATDLANSIVLSHLENVEESNILYDGEPVNVIHLQENIHIEEESSSPLESGEVIQEAEAIQKSEIVIEKPMKESGLEEVDFHLEELSNQETFQLKERNDVYYEIYKQAVKKAKLAREMAISSYLEAKEIKNTYRIEEINDSDESDLDDDDFHFVSNKNAASN